MSTHKVKKNFLLIGFFVLLIGLTACNAMSPANLEALLSPTNVSVDNVSTEKQIEASEADPLTVDTKNTEIYQASTDLEADLIDVYQTANSSIVYIITETGSGSGFVYSEDGLIVTNHHVITGSNNIEVVFSNGDRQRAEVIGDDVDADIAVIQVEQLPDGVAALPLADSDSLVVGQFVVAIGNPFGEQGSMSFGIISGLGRSLASQRELEMGSTYSLPEVIQTDTPINPGNSGGPLLNLLGEVVGINTAIASTSGTSSGVGFAIPVNAVSRIVPSLIENGEYNYPYMGAGFLSELSLDAQEQLGLDRTRGAYVISVTPGSPADDAGLIPGDETTGLGGDLIIALDGKPIADFADLNSYLVFETEVGQTIEITVLRDGEEVSFPLTLGDRP